MEAIHFRIMGAKGIRRWLERVVRDLPRIPTEARDGHRAVASCPSRQGGGVRLSEVYTILSQQYSEYQDKTHDVGVHEGSLVVMSVSIHLGHPRWI